MKCVAKVITDQDSECDGGGEVVDDQMYNVVPGSAVLVAGSETSVHPERTTAFLDQYPVQRVLVPVSSESALLSTETPPVAYRSWAVVQLKPAP